MREGNARNDHDHVLLDLLAEHTGNADWQRALQRDPAKFLASRLKLTGDGWISGEYDVLKDEIRIDVFVRVPNDPRLRPISFMISRRCMREDQFLENALRAQATYCERDAVELGADIKIAVLDNRSAFARMGEGS